MRRTDRRTTWHDRFLRFAFLIEVNLSEMPIGLSISRDAQVLDAADVPPFKKDVVAFRVIVFGIALQDEHRSTKILEGTPCPLTFFAN
jgi:hypothetical protein